MSNSSQPNGSVVIRARRDADLSACADLVREVHAADRYPRFLPADITRFLNPPDPFGCWIADLDGEVAGHVALVARGLPATTEIAASALGQPAGQLAVVARLFVSPRARGRGAGQLLLGAATAEARSRGLHPVLDVDIELAAAIVLYESAGWTRAGQLTVRWTVSGSGSGSGSGSEVWTCAKQDTADPAVERVLTEYVYVGPHAG